MGGSRIASRLRSDVGSCGEIADKRVVGEPHLCCGCGFLAGVQRTRR